jgi:hypothetical protein
VKAQVDFIESRFKGKEQADVIVHEHCGEAGAIGAALEAGRLWDNGRVSTFIGLDAISQDQLQDHARRSHPLLLLQEQVPAHLHRRQDQHHQYRLQALQEDQGPLEAGAQRLIIATCEKGTVETSTTCADQGRPGQDQEGQSQLRGYGRQGRVPRARRAAGGRPAAQVPDHRRAEEARRADEEALRDPHRHAARAQHVLA